MADALPQFSWYLLDLPGTGGSEPIANASARSFSEWLQGFCEEAGIESFHLAGHSLGGNLALAAAATGKVRLRSLLLIDGGLNPIAVPEQIGKVAYLVPAIALLDSLLGGRIVARRKGSPAPPGSAADPQKVAEQFQLPMSENLERAVLDTGATDGAAWDLDGMALSRFGLIGVRTRGLRSLRRVDVPTRILVARFPHGPEWAAALARRSLESVREAGIDAVEMDTGHYVFWEDAEAFSRAVRDFYAGITHERTR